ncbi:MULTISPECIES: sigma-70 family RNA polymerase sigma factor [Pseudomonas]|uniref:sigma-70 family RNA polymerase sigma factor n=1 Tax=Pseudomonas TaxID=286 RepID=UPI0009E844F2|nr:MULTISPECIES: sigma-70 family RNA polymerase sigma factor [Pseudomonas]PYC09132.1 RNA polymerase subunit sigma [Pseudomonas sp. MB-090624]MBH3386567.1 sigma-70 family RNA polymerase sigma factor [Pseudomonas juntendi]MBR7519802.1 sigma-70 family RNA polymerase sigma factor [Pseudomonas juntendi]WBM34702.1 sigma-70 family RNA polymerase sigma factor [Pseudomonas sp. NY11382]WDM61048.1 sigma-70 family RNA polymerase sigma factor [Pseudomonas sp. NEEL19]
MAMHETDAIIPLEALYHNERGWLHAWLRRSLGCSQQAADLAQDTFVRLLVRNQPISARAPRALLARIARGLVVDHWRRDALQRAYLQALAQLPDASYPSPAVRHEALQCLERIAQLLDGLKPAVREAFLLYQLAGLTHAQVAEQLGVSGRTVERHVAQALLHCYRVCFE